MRTTITIDDDLHRQVKEVAARSGRPIAAVIEDAVRRGISVPESRTGVEYHVRAMGTGGLRPGADLSSNAAVSELMADGLRLDVLH